MLVGSCELHQRLLKDIEQEKTPLIEYLNLLLYW